MAIEHRRFDIQGRVQGVFFRQSARAEAQRLMLTGYAQNNADASVTIEAEGPVQALDTLETWCRHGPATARVDTVAVASGPLQHFAGFTVRR